MNSRIPLSPSRTKRRERPAAATPVPMAGETQLQFFLRASRVLWRSIPSVNWRTLRILKLWAASPNARELQAKAREQFPADKFVHAGPRCVFVEHTVPASRDGSRGEIKYGRNELQHLVNWANYRIRNAGNFAAISDGHTPSREEKVNGVPDPDVLGYAGPFYLGLLGDVDPRWAIYADEWVHAQDLPRFMKLQRRSPEVWANEPMESRTMDPIAALGSATPCLDSGMNPYCRSSDGRLVMRYSAMTFAAGGPISHRGKALLGRRENASARASSRRALQRSLTTSPCVSSTVTRNAGPNRHRYSGDHSMPFPVDDDAKGTLAQAVGEAMQAILPNLIQGVFERLNAGDGETPPPEDGPLDDAADTVDETDDVGPEADQEATPEIDLDPDDQSDGQQGATRYSRSEYGLSAIVARQSREIQQLRSELGRERRDVARFSRLGELSRRFAFDPAEEFEACRDMNDRQFEQHCERTVSKYARRDDVGYLDLPDDLEPSRYSADRARRISPAQIERFSREAASLAARKNAAKSGSTTFEAEFNAICKQHGMTL